MARDVVVRELCDVCLRVDGTKVDAIWSEVVTIGRVRRQLALCTLHFEKIVDQFLDVLREHGSRPDVESVAPAPVTPLIEGQVPCPHCSRLVASKGGLLLHIRVKHPEHYVGAPAPSSVRCEECGATFKGPQGLGSHRSRAHGVPGKSQQSQRRHELKAQAPRARKTA